MDDNTNAESERFLNCIDTIKAINSAFSLYMEISDEPDQINQVSYLSSMADSLLGDEFTVEELKYMIKAQAINVYFIGRMAARAYGMSTTAVVLGEDLK